MATRVYILSAADFKNLSPTHRNVDSELIKQSIIACQDMFVQPIIGTSLLNEIKDEVSADTLTADNKTLLEDHIHDAMLFWILKEIVRPITYHYTNIGVQTKDSERTQPIDVEEVRRIENHYDSRAMFYAQRLMDFLCENSSTYPLYENPTDGIDIINPKSRAYNTGLWLGGGRGKKYTGLDTYFDEDWER